MDNFAFIVGWFCVVLFIIYVNRKARKKGIYKPCKKRNQYKSSAINVAEYEFKGLL